MGTPEICVGAVWTPSLRQRHGLLRALFKLSRPRAGLQHQGSVSTQPSPESTEGTQMKRHRIVSLLALTPLLFGATSCAPILTGGTFQVGMSGTGEGASPLREGGLTHDFSVSNDGKLVIENDGPGALRGELRSAESPQSVATFRLVGRDELLVDLEPGDAGSVSVFCEGEDETSVMITIYQQH